MTIDVVLIGWHALVLLLLVLAAIAVAGAAVSLVLYLAAAVQHWRHNTQQSGWGRFPDWKDNQ